MATFALSATDGPLKGGGMDSNFDSVVDDVGQVVDTIPAIAAWTSGHVGFVWAVVIIAVIIAISRAISRRTSATDPTRLFTSDQRREGMVRAENRCEMPKFFGLMRCRRRAEHGDHYFPWSRGGATTMGNYVAACAKCNLAKSNHVPTSVTTLFIAVRRRRYFPEGIPLHPGQRYQGI